MARVLRGEIYWADLNPVQGREQAGLRPVLVISQIRTLSTQRLGRKLGTVFAEELARLIDGLFELVA